MRLLYDPLKAYNTDIRAWPGPHKVLRYSDMLSRAVAREKRLRDNTLNFADMVEHTPSGLRVAPESGHCISVGSRRRTAAGRVLPPLENR